MTTLEEVKLSLIKNLEARKADGCLEQSNASLLTELINNADSTYNAIAIAALGTTYKRTGFNFEKKLEKIGSDIKYFVHNEELSFKNDKNALTHHLIIGDNYDALLNLLITHKNKIDVIYIDPPYGKDSMGIFAETNYDNAITRDNLLSMLYPRLILAKKLLAEEGTLFCSIDDKNEAYIKCLMDEIFLEKNFIASTFVLDNLKGKAQDNFITNVGHKMLIYAKNKIILAEQGGFQQTENSFGKITENKFKNVDDKGEYNEVSFKKSGLSRLREDRPTMYYPILEKNNELSTITDDEYKKIYNKEDKTFADDFVEQLKKQYTNKGYNFILPINGKNEYVRWTSSFDSGFKRLLKEKSLFYRDGNIYEKKRPSEKEMLQQYALGTQKSLFYKTSYANGTQNLDDVIGGCKFDFPKSVELIKDILKLIRNKNAIVLDFFAGSGTTGQAVLDLNKEDEGKRKFILCTNNEITEDNPTGIAYEITSERLKRVMTGKAYNGSTDFKWIKENNAYRNNLEVLEIESVNNAEQRPNKTPFDVIDETCYGLEKFKTLEEKIQWVCENFDKTQKYIKEN